MKKISTEYVCDICEESAGSENWSKIILEFVDIRNLESNIRFIEDSAKEIHLCDSCKNVVGKFIELTQGKKVMSNKQKGLNIAILCKTIYDGQMFLREQDEEFIKKSPNLFLDKYGNQYRLFSNSDVVSSIRGYRFTQIIVVGWQVDNRLIDCAIVRLYGDIIPEEYKVQYV